ncbi:oligogalacturonide lyase [Paenibacillus sp. 1_12]|uniref:oligogalacturonate lyase family protein n=1 Tax=Paenibacillus sp. 1_12 TaxID=1566278 RepID=UPI0008E0B2DD|nr:oligogalacturonate lyase family protein [Paenibacillus sp. 1_12]SFK99348.1 oligogalacturonide lyase [Paenibacillus sp. 1_12]
MMNQGNKGAIWAAEMRRYQDPISGVPIKQLTDYASHSHHLYFTDNGWFDEGQRVLFISDRNNATNLYSVHVESGEIIQLTDLTGRQGLNVCLNPSGTEAYYQRANRITKLDLITLEETVLYEGPNGFHLGQLSCTADGKHVITVLSENLSHRIRIDLGNGYVGHREIMEAQPFSQIIRVSTKDGEMNVVFEERNWVGHINTSQTQPQLLTYCHEGPWELVDHRIWGCDMDTGRTWKIRERTEPLEKVGHEYWMEDGLTIGFHGFRADGTGFIGKINSDNTGLEEVEFNFRNWHAHSNDFSQVVVDGRAPLTLMIYWKKEENGFSQPKILCEHRCSFHSQDVHAHPRFSPDGSKLLFTSDKNGYGNLYVLDIPEDARVLPNFMNP